MNYRISRKGNWIIKPEMASKLGILDPREGYNEIPRNITGRTSNDGEDIIITAAFPITTLISSRGEYHFIEFEAQTSTIKEILK